MKRDILSINSTEVRVLGKSNIYANLGFYKDLRSVTTSDVEIDAPAFLGQAADIRAAFSYKHVSEVTTNEGQQLVLADKDLLPDSEHGDALTTFQYRLRYDTPTDSSDLTNLTGSIYARTSLENLKILSHPNANAIPFIGLLPKGHSLAETVASASEISSLGFVFSSGFTWHENKFS